MKQSQSFSRSEPTLQNLYQDWKNTYNKYIEFTNFWLKEVRKPKYGISLLQTETKAIKLFDQNITLYDQNMDLLKRKKEEEGVLHERMKGMDHVYDSLLSLSEEMLRSFRQTGNLDQITKETIINFFSITYKRFKMYFEAFEKLCSNSLIFSSKYPLNFINSIFSEKHQGYSKLADFWRSKTILEMYEKLFNPLITLIDTQEQSIKEYQANKQINIFWKFLKLLQFMLINLREHLDVLKTNFDQRKNLKETFPEMVVFFKLIHDFFSQIIDHVTAGQIMGVDQIVALRNTFPLVLDRLIEEQQINKQEQKRRQTQLLQSFGQLRVQQIPKGTTPIPPTKISSPTTISQQPQKSQKKQKTPSSSQQTSSVRRQIQVPITKFRHLPVRKKQEQTQQHYEKRNALVQKIKNKNQTHIYQQIGNKNLIPLIYNSALEKKAKFIYLVDVSNFAHEFFHNYMKINYLREYPEFLQYIENEMGLEKSSKIYWVLINQGDYVRESNQRITILERSPNGILLEVSCLTKNKKKKLVDCFKIEDTPNPMDDLTLLVLEKGLLDFKKKLEQLNLREIELLKEQLSNIEPFVEKSRVMRIQYGKLNAQIKKLEKQLPIILRLTKDNYTDFEPIQYFF